MKRRIDPWRAAPFALGCVAFGVMFEVPMPAFAAAQARVTPPTAALVPRADVVFTVERHGEIRVRVDPRLAPNHCAQFLARAAEGAYRGRAIHRVIPGFIVQSGENVGPADSTSAAGPSKKERNTLRVPAEPATQSMTRGSVAMAWRGCVPGTAEEEWFICLTDLPALERCGTRIGQVVAGMEVVDRIAQTSTDPAARPLRPVLIEAVRVEPWNDAPIAPPPPLPETAPSDEESAESEKD